MTRLLRVAIASILLTLVMLPVAPVAGDVFLYESGLVLQYCDALGCYLTPAAGVSASITISPESVQQGETIAELIGLDNWVQGIHYWIQTGIVIGQLPDNSFTSSPVLYTEVNDGNGYFFNSVGSASFGNTYDFQISYSGGSPGTCDGSGTWSITINNVNKGGWSDRDLSCQGQQVSAIIENHEPTSLYPRQPNNTGNGHWSNLEWYYNGIWGTDGWYTWGSPNPNDLLPNSTQGYIVGTVCGDYNVFQVSQADFTAQGISPCTGGGGGGRTLRT